MAITPILDDMVNEVNISFDYYENQFDKEVDEVYLTGGMAGMAFMAEYLAKALGKPCTRWDPAAGLEIRKPVTQEMMDQYYNRLTIPLGLAARILTL